MAQLGSLMILVAILAVGYLVWWVIKNDQAGDTGKTTGWFAMNDYGDEDAENAVDLSAAEAEDRKKRPWLYHD